MFKLFRIGWDPSKLSHGGALAGIQELLDTCTAYAYETGVREGVYCAHSFQQYGKFWT